MLSLSVLHRACAACVARFRAETGRFRPQNMPGWFHPGQSMCVWCGRGDLNPHDLFRVCGFSYHFGFRRLATRVRGLDYPFTIPRERFRCCPSSLYTFPKISGLGSGLPVKVSPTLSSSTPPVSLAGTQFLKSYRSYFALDGSNSQRLYICLVMNQMQRPIDCIELLRQV